MPVEDTVQRYLLKDLNALKIGVHLCCIYTSREEQFEVVIPFIKRGLGEGRRCVYIADENTAEDVAAEFKKTGVDVDKFCREGRLQFLTKNESYLRDGYFDPDRMIGFIADAEARAVAEGFSGLFVTGEMTWIFTGLPGVEKVIEYEIKLNKFFPGSKSSAICQYNETRFKHEMLVDVIRTHPKVILSRHLCENPYYTPPEEFVPIEGEERAGSIYRRLKEDLLARAIVEFEKRKADEQLKLNNQIFENLAEGIYLVGFDDLLIKYATPKFEKMFGYDAGELTGKDVSIVNAPTDKSPRKIRDEIVKVIKDTGEWHGEVENIKKDGTRFFCHANVSIFNHPEYGKVIVSVHSDISRRKEMEEKVMAGKKFLMDILNSITHPFYVIDAASYKIVMANDASGLPAGDATCHMLTHKSAMPCSGEHTCPLDEVKRTKMPATVEHVHYSPDGSPRQVEVHGYPIFDDSGEVVQMIEYCFDVTERRQMEYALRESEEKYKMIFRQSADSIVLIDPEDGRFVEFSESAFRNLGYTKDEFENLRVGDIEVFESIKGAAKRKDDILKGGEETFESRHRKKDGEVIDVLINKRWVNVGGRRYIQAVFHDITLVKRNEEYLKERLVEKTEGLLRAERELANARRLSDIGQLASTIAHELRNPLGVIRAAAYNINRKINNPDIAGNLANIDKKIMESDQIIQNILSYSRVKMPNYKAADIISIVEECLSDMREGYRNFDVVVEKKIGCGEGIVVECDPGQMTELFSNIIDNAYKAFPEKKGVLDVEAELFEDGRVLGISFRDNGEGIGEEDLGRVFEPFFTTRTKGTGLGLAVCRQIVELHGGTIDIKSEKGQGSTVTVRLPVRHKT